MEKSDDPLNEQLEQAKKALELANTELEIHRRKDEILEADSRPIPYLKASDFIIESSKKYGVFDDVKDEDAGEILGLLTDKQIDTASGTVTDNHSKAANRFASDGDVWSISYGGKTASLNHWLGLR